MPVELGFILHRFAEMAEEDPALRDRQPWKAAWDKDYAWLGAVITKHYHGDDSDVKVLMGGILQAFAGMTVTAYTARADAFLRQAPHPSLGRLLRECAYLPMVELLRYLEANGFATYIASGGDRDFMRPGDLRHLRHPAGTCHRQLHRVFGTARTRGSGTLVYEAQMDVFDDGPMKPVRIWSRTGRQPLVAGGNSNGDIPMLQYAGGTATAGLRLLVLHDDDDREFGYTAGAEESLDRARGQDWTVVSMKSDWSTVFAEALAR